MRKLVTTTLILTLIIVTGFLLTPSALVGSAAVPDLPDDLDAYIANREQAAAARFALIPGTEKRIRWQLKGQRTEYSIVYLPGFSATRQEIAPAPELIADALHANLFETRLTGHGRAQGAMIDVAAEDWLDDGVEALAIGARLGEHVIVIGTSTGATLAMAMTDHAAMQNVEALVLISPNFAPKDAAAQWLTKPAGPLLARLKVGETRTWIPHNDQQARYWSTSYPMKTMVEVMRLVDLTQARLPLALEQSLLTLLSPNDTVVSTESTLDALDRISAPRKQLLQFEQVGDPSNHVLAGDILSPDTTEEIVAAIVAFIRSEDSTIVD